MTDSTLQNKYDQQALMLVNRVKKDSKRYAKLNLEIFRLYDWEIPEIRAVVDWYADHLVFGEYSRKQSTPGWRPLMGKSVGQALGVPKNRPYLKIRRAGIKEGTRYRRLNNINKNSTTRMTGKYFDIARDHPGMLNLIFEKMKSVRAVFFSTNHQSFEMKTGLLTVADVKEITSETIPEDYISKRKQIHRAWEIIV